MGKAQNVALVIQSGTTVGLTGNSLVLNNLDLHNNGTLSASAGTVWLTGTNSTSFNGTGVTVIQTLQLNTAPSSVLSLNSGLEISGSLNFLQGLIDLNGQEIQLQGAATLQGESETSRITGVTGGNVTAGASGVNAPNQLNIGNLGAMLTTSSDLGSVTITRAHVPATNSGNPAVHGIQRTYLIQPTNDAALYATLRFFYLDAELDGNDSTTLSLWTSTDGVTWGQAGWDVRNTTQKYVEKQGLPSLSYWTLSAASNPLPLTLITFTVTCDGNEALVQWKTGEESNLDYFLVERSPDGSAWTALNKVAPTNNPTGSSYAYKDNQPAGTAYYRLEIVDLAGNITYSPVFRGGCADIALPLTVYPNPSESEAVARVSVRQAANGTMVIMDMNGQRVYQASWSLQPGINQLVIPVYRLAAGNYIVQLLLPGASPQQVQILKK